MDLLFAILTQAIIFIPLAMGISISYHILKATDMTMDGSFVLGAAIFAKAATSGVPPTLCFFLALCGGALAGCMTAFIQYGGKVDSLLAGILATFILTSVNLLIMAKPNINLLAVNTLFSTYFNDNEMLGWSMVFVVVGMLMVSAALILQSRLGLKLRAFADNPNLFQRLGYHPEWYRILGFSLTNLLAASSGCITAQTIGYADVGMGLGMTLTGIGAIIIGQQILSFFPVKLSYRLLQEFIACCAGVLIYFFVFNGLIHLDVNPIYLKMLLGLLLILFLRSTDLPKSRART